MRKTKIICTIGPTSESEEVIRRLIMAGMNTARFNFSHGDHASHKKKINRVRDIAEELGQSVAILLDTKGPEIRTHNFKDGLVNLYEGDTVDIVSGKEILGNEKEFSITYDKLSEDVKVGSKILIDDGLVALEVLEVNPNRVKCLVLNNGTVSDHKGINLPGIKTQFPALTEKDLDDLKFGIDMGVDIIAASFIRKADDVLEVRKALRNFGSEDIILMSKIENEEGVDNVEEIIKYSDGIMVARGDMGVEIPLERVPLAQKEIIEMCNKHGKPVVTATQMLDSMIRFPRPTRAEVSDVANAIYDGTDCIMLSGETANGRYPIEALQTMVKIAVESEKKIRYEKVFDNIMSMHVHSVPTAISLASATTAYELDASAIITATVSGSTAKNVSRYKPKAPILAVTPSKSVARRLSIYWGVYPIVSTSFKSTDEMIQKTAQLAKERGFVRNGDLVVITAGLPINFIGSTNMIKVHLIGEALLQGKSVHNVDKTVSGVIRKVSSFDAANTICEKGDILVVNSLTDEYLDILHRISGVIVETNQISSKVLDEIIAHDIPVVSDATKALSVLADGTLVKLDAKRSIILNSEEAGHESLQ